MSVQHKKQALEGLVALGKICKSALSNLGTPRNLPTNVDAASVGVLRKDALSFYRLIYMSTTRLSVSLGKDPPSYVIAIVPLKELASHVAQLEVCLSSLPPGVLRKEAVLGAGDIIRALERLVALFESQCMQDGHHGDAYLAMTGVVHEAVVKAEDLSGDEKEAIVKAWKLHETTLADSLKELKQMMTEKDVGHGDIEGDGWDELGEGFGVRLSTDEMERVNKIYPLVRFTTLLHEKVLSQHILKCATIEPCHLTNLFAFSNSLLLATDELVSALYAPQDIESIQAAVEVVHRLTQDLDRELNGEPVTGDEVAAALESLSLGSVPQDLAWFKKCFSQINIIYDSLLLIK